MSEGSPEGTDDASLDGRNEGKVLGKLDKSNEG
jgi:hypothetical protein